MEFCLYKKKKVNQKDTTEQIMKMQKEREKGILIAPLSCLPVR